MVKSLQAENGFAVAQVVKKYSPLVSAESLKISESSIEEIQKVDSAVKSLYSLWDGHSDPPLIDSLKSVAASGLFAIPDIFMPIISRDNSLEKKSELDNLSEIPDINLDIEAWEKALSSPFSQLEFYVQYIFDKSPFKTHQGIKGLQFPRVMVVLDDNEARGFMFSYDKLFGAQELTTTDQRNADDGKETSVDRTRRLFYVTCSRAQDSLAIVVYTKEKDKIINHLQNLKWFEEDEIIDLNCGEFRGG